MNTKNNLVKEGTTEGEGIKEIKCMKCDEVATVRIYKDGLSGHCCTDCAMEFQSNDKNINLSWLSL